MNKEELKAHLVDLKLGQSVALKALDQLILETPTGKTREVLTEINIHVGLAVLATNNLIRSLK